MPEWSNGAVSKIAVGFHAPPGVRIPPSPSAKAMSEIVKELKPYLERGLDPIVSLLHQFKIHPNFITVLGFFLVIVGSYFLYINQDLMALLFLTLGALADACDGSLARKYNKNTTFGAFLDSVLDRFSDAFPFIALTFRFEGIMSLMCILAILFSFSVSYTRARAEGLGYDLKVGIFERPERWIILLISVLLGAVELGVLIIFIGSFVTTIQRVYTFMKISDRR